MEEGVIITCKQTRTPRRVRVLSRDEQAASDQEKFFCMCFKSIFGLFAEVVWLTSSLQERRLFAAAAAGGQSFEDECVQSRVWKGNHQAAAVLLWLHHRDANSRYYLVYYFTATSFKQQVKRLPLMETLFLLVLKNKTLIFWWCFSTNSAVSRISVTKSSFAKYESVGKRCIFISSFILSLHLRVW